MRTIGSIAVATMLFSAGLLGLINFVSEDVSALSWNIEIVDSGGVTAMTSIALDSKGYPHISYQDGNSDLKYANWTGTQWMIQTLDSAGLTGLFSSIDVDNNDYPHISYVDRTNELLKYTVWNGTGWSKSVVEAIGFRLSQTSIALNGSDYPRIGYHNSISGDLRYAVWNGTAWNIDIVDSGPGMGANCLSMVLDGSYIPHFSYCDGPNGTMKYAKWSGSMWSTQYVVTTPWVNMITSIDVDSNSRAHISYLLDDPDFDIAHSWWTGSTWSKDIVDDGGYGGTADSLAIDNSDTPHICYYHWPSGDLMYANWTGSGWDNYTVDSVGDVGNGCSIALDINGYPHIAYGDQFSQKLRYARYGVPPATTPSAPRTLQASGGNAQVQLDWIAPSSDGGSPITNYRIYRGTTPGGEVFLDEIGNVLSYLDTAVTNGITYYYQVTALNALGEGPKSNEASATPSTGQKPPSEPEKLLANAGDGLISVSWNPPISDGNSSITNYRIYRGTAPGGEAFLLEIGNTTMHNDIGLMNGQIYYYKVSAVNGIGEGPLSNGSYATPTSVPGAPTIMQASLTGYMSQNITIMWSLSSDDGSGQNSVVGYEIYKNGTYDSNGLGYSLSGFVPGGSTELTIKFVGEGDPDNYFYRICAVDLNGRTKCATNQAAKYTRPLVVGPNLISLPLIQSDENIQTILQTVSYDAAWSFDAISEEWRSFTKSKPFDGTFQSANHTDGIWVDVTLDSNFTVAGIVPISTMINLRAGWNLVSFPSFVITYSVVDLKATIAFEAIQGFNQSASPYWLKNMLDSDFLQAGFGFWIRVNTETVWTIDNT
jgi:fibronectin type 3 domain-containing protein